MDIKCKLKRNKCDNEDVDFPYNFKQNFQKEVCIYTESLSELNFNRERCAYIAVYLVVC